MLVEPVSGVSYPVATTWAGDALRFEIAFGPELAAFCRRDGARIDLATSAVVWPNGHREDALGARAEFRRFTGVEPPPWLFRLPQSPRAFVVPRGRALIDAQPNGALLLEPSRECTPIFTALHRRDPPETPSPTDREYIPLLHWPALRFSLCRGVTVLSTSEHEARLVDAAIDDVCGERGVEWRRKEKERETLFIVSPRGKHFSALPELRLMRERLLKPAAAMDEHGVTAQARSGFAAVTITGERTRYICVTGDDLAGQRTSTLHEIFHLLEAEMLSPQEIAWLDRWHTRTVERGGPFARPYGFMRREFLPTMGELLFGGDGAWVREHHRALVQWLEAATSCRACA